MRGVAVPPGHTEPAAGGRREASTWSYELMVFPVYVVSFGHRRRGAAQWLGMLRFPTWAEAFLYVSEVNPEFYVKLTILALL